MLRVSAHGQFLIAKYPTRNGYGERHAGSGFRSVRRVFDARVVECDPSRAITQEMQTRHGAFAKQFGMAAARWRIEAASRICGDPTNVRANSSGALCGLWRLQIGGARIGHCILAFTKACHGIPVTASSAIAFTGDALLWPRRMREICEREIAPCVSLARSLSLRCLDCIHSCNSFIGPMCTRCTGLCKPLLQKMCI